MMNEQDLLDRMAASTSWTQVVDADLDDIVAHGRRRRRRRRAQVAATLSTAVAMVLGIATYPHETPPALDRSVPTATRSAESPAPIETDPRVRPETSRATAARLLAVLGKHIDPERSHLTLWANTDVWGEKTHVTARWRQDGGQGMALITLGALPGVERLIRCDRPGYGGSMREYGPWAPDAIRYTCGWDSGAGNVVVGTADVDGVRSYIATYYRYLPWPVVTVQILGRPGFKRSASDPEPVPDPDVTIEQLIAAVTDPELSVNPP